MSSNRSQSHGASKTMEVLTVFENAVHVSAAVYILVCGVLFACVEAPTREFFLNNFTTSHLYTDMTYARWLEWVIRSESLHNLHNSDATFCLTGLPIQGQEGFAKPMDRHARQLQSHKTRLATIDWTSHILLCTAFEFKQSESVGVQRQKFSQYVLCVDYIWSVKQTWLLEANKALDIYVSGFTCKLFSQESNSRYSRGNGDVTALFTTRDIANWFDWKMACQFCELYQCKLYVVSRQ